MGFERVYTVYDYHDRPRSGIAEYSGQPHYYHCEWNEGGDNYTETFILTPIDDKTLSLALQQWAIWLKWEHKFHRGEVPQSTHPALPGQDLKYAELEAVLNRHILESSAQNKRVRGTFRPLTNQSPKPAGAMKDLEVEWAMIA